ncbi:MAG: ATPase, T2SS/T4P/T4SS family [Betaproteobacteria bacterium]|nr:ATPase, T2SS/T4P/T4SS family [Betaproteobacteria bacterium]
MSLLDTIIKQIRSDVPWSDLHVEQDAPVMAMLPGGWAEADVDYEPDHNDLEHLLGTLNKDWQQIICKQAIKRTTQLDDWRVRLTAYMASGGAKYVMSVRRVPVALPTIQGYALPDVLEVIARSRSGLFLVSGPTRSGKSTTLAAMIDYVNSGFAKHIVTVEDPIEFAHARKRSIITSREVGIDVVSFHQGVVDAMRQTPDVIMVGEIRDSETAEVALLAAESGHFVLASLHGHSVPLSIQKLLNFFPGREREAKANVLASHLVGAMSQQLLPRADRKGWALASEWIFNYQRRFTKNAADLDALGEIMARDEHAPYAMTMRKSVMGLTGSGKVRPEDAAAAIDIDFGTGRA